MQIPIWTQRNLRGLSRYSTKLDDCLAVCGEEFFARSAALRFHARDVPRRQKKINQVKASSAETPPRPGGDALGESSAALPHFSECKVSPCQYSEHGIEL